MPVRMSCITAASLSLCGMPFLRGFYSKDLIIEIRFQGGDRLVIYFILIVGTLFTSWYSLRLIFNLFLSTNKSVSPVIHAEEARSVKFAYRGLLISSVIIGFLLVNLVSDLDFTAMVSNAEKFVVILLVVLAISIIEVFAGRTGKTKFLVGVYGYLASIWHFKPLLAQFSPSAGLKLASLITVRTEKGWLEKVGPQGAFGIVQTLGFINQKIQSYHFLKFVLGLLFRLFIVIILGGFL